MTNIVNVGIRKDQKQALKKGLRWGDSLNAKVQEAIDCFLKEKK